MRAILRPPGRRRHDRSMTDRSATRLGVHSEVGRLRQVVLHRPGLELERLTPATVHELLFEDVLWAERAREEHDAFADVLGERGIVAHLLSTLLAGAL